VLKTLFAEEKKHNKNRKFKLPGNTGWK